MNANAFDPRIRAYFGDEVLRAGFVPLPHLFLRHYRKLGLSHLQALFVLQLMEIVWDLGDSPSSVARLAERLGVDRRTVQICSKELQDMGLVEIFDQWDQSGAQVENGYDLTSLFRRLAAVDEQPAARTLIRRSRRTTNDERPTTTATTAPRGHPRPPSTEDDHRPTTTDTQELKSLQFQGTLDEGSSVTQIPNPISQIPVRAPVRSGDRTSRGSVDHTGPGSVDHAGVDAGIIPPLATGSGLNTKKKQTKKQQEREKKQQQAAPVQQTDTPKKRPGTHGGGGTAKQAMREVQPAPTKPGYSLRWNVELNNDQTLQSRSILERAGLHRHIAAEAATALHPGEAWTLRLYARAAHLSPAWIARQVYDFQSKRTRPADISAHYDQAGRLFAVLTPDAAEQLCDLLDRACPGQVNAIEQTVAAALGCEASMTAALKAGWSVMAEQRGGPLHLPDAALPSFKEPGGEATPSLWQRVLDRLHAHVAPEAFATWLGATVLLEHEPDLVVIGTPNVFVRDEVVATYRAAIEEALQAELGHGVRVEIVIGSAAQAVH